MSQQVVVGVAPLEVHRSVPRHRPLRPAVLRRGRARRLLAGALVGASLLITGLALGLAWAGEGALALAVLPAAVALLAGAAASWQSGEQLAATVRDGLVVPARARVVRGPDELELSFVVGRQPAWEQLFPPHGDEPVTLMLHYELDGREYLAVDVVEAGDRVACVDLAGAVTPAVLVRRERPDRPVVLTEGTLGAAVA